MARLERLRQQVADEGIIPRREGAEGLPTEIYYLKVKELAQLVEDPTLAPSFIEMARIRSRKRRRRKYIKDKAVDAQFGAGYGHSDRVAAALGDHPRCLGFFIHKARIVSETGFAKAQSGYVYDVGDRRIVLADSEAQHAWVRLGVPMLDEPYDGDDLNTLLWVSVDRMYRPLMEG